MQVQGVEDLEVLPSVDHGGGDPHLRGERLYVNAERSWERRSAGCVASGMMKRRATGASLCLAV